MAPKSCIICSETYFNLIKIYFILNTLKSIFVNTDTAFITRKPTILSEFFFKHSLTIIPFPCHLLVSPNLFLGVAKDLRSIGHAMPLFWNALEESVLDAHKKEALFVPWRFNEWRSWWLMSFECSVEWQPILELKIMLSKIQHFIQKIHRRQAIFYKRRADVTQGLVNGHSAVAVVGV